MSTVSKVKPCPFCGSTNIYLAKVRSLLDTTKLLGQAVECQECGANVPGEDKESALDKWNERYGSTIQ